MANKYGIRGFPTVLFTDATGKEVARLQGRDAQSVIRQIESVVAQHSSAPAGGASDGDGLEEIAAQAVKDEKLIAVLFVDPKKEKKLADVRAALEDEELAELKERFVWVEQPVKLEDGKRNPLARTFGVSSGPYLVLIDPRAEELNKKAVLGKTSAPKSIEKKLSDALAKAEAK